jgi:hypothetical protein
MFSLFFSPAIVNVERLLHFVGVRAHGRRIGRLLDVGHNAAHVGQHASLQRLKRNNFYIINML